MKGLLFAVYNLLITLSLPLVIPYHLYRSWSRGRQPAFAERMGLQLPLQFTRVPGQQVFWVHAVSVGETIAAKPLLEGLTERFAGCRILLSCGTETGRAIAESLAVVDHAMYFPFFDWRPAVDRFFTRISPTAVIVMETEIWPNFLRAARQRRIPVLMANGRISDRSYGRYLSFSWFFRLVLPEISAFCMQSALDAERILAIGAPAERVQVGNNLKYDLQIRKLDQEKRKDSRRRWRLPLTAPIIVAGSTHAGEEEMILSALKTLRLQFPEVCLVLVPRHPERAAEVAALLELSGFSVLYSSRLHDAPEFLSGCDVLLVDKVGQLMELYGAADVVFVGGSLVPHGGHNILEPASWGVPVLHGPNMHNFREIADLFAAAAAARVVHTADELAKVISELLFDRSAALCLGQAGARLVAENGGATERHLLALEKLLNNQGPGKGPGSGKSLILW